MADSNEVPEILTSFDNTDSDLAIDDIEQFEDENNMPNLSEELLTNNLDNAQLEDTKQKTTTDNYNSLDDSKESYFDAYDFEQAASKIENNINEKIGYKMQNASNNVITDSTYNRARNIIDSFRNQINTNKNETEQKPANNNSIEEFVSELIKPMIKEWLDQNLHSIVEEVVSKEVKKITDNDQD